MERTLVFLKPDAIVRGLVGEIIGRFEAKGLKLVAMKMMYLTDPLLESHYSHLSNKPFFAGIKRFMKSTPVAITCWEGVDAIETSRRMCGPTNARNAPAGTIRGDLSVSNQSNLVHASDGSENARVEISRFFNANEVFSYDLPTAEFLYSDDERHPPSS